MPNAYDYATQHADRFKDQLIELLRVPSISTLDAHADDVRAAADWIIADMQRIGLENVRKIEHDTYLPLVYGEYNGAGPDAATVLVYCHYDVQPAEMADGWTSDPFTPVERDGKVYARGALDSKVHVIAQLKAIESMLAAEGGLPVNVKVLFEGEEESGSEHIFGFVPENLDLLAADTVVVSDGSMPDPAQPILVYGLRGLVTMRLTVTGPQRDLHSGHYGGNVHNPIQALAEIIAQLHDADGHVTVPGFYDDVRPLSESERALLAGVEPWVKAEWQSLANAPQIWGEPDYSMSERMGARPTLEINGIGGGFYGDGFKTVLPHRAGANISCRLVPDQNPAKILAALDAYIQHLTPPTVTATLTETEAGAPGILIDRESAPVQAASPSASRIKIRVAYLMRLL